MSQLSRLDREIATAQHAFIALCFLRNSHTPVSRLPSEILTHIFSFFRVSHLDPPDSPCFPPSWIAVTHVCRRWRDVALSSPGLWTNIVMNNKRWMKATLARSRNAPISLHLELTYMGVRTDPEVVWVALSHARRVKEISFKGSYLDPYLRPLFKLAAPLLESLHLCDKSSSFDLRKGIFLLGQAPKLQSLKLEGCIVNWNSPLLFCPTLTLLSISFFDRAPQHRLSAVGLRDILMALPNLQYLTLHNMIPTPMSTLEDPDAKIHLQQLKTLSLSTDVATDIMGVISHLLVPENATLRVECNAFGQGYQDSPTSPEVPLATTLASFYETTSMSNSERARTDGYHAIGFASPDNKYTLVAGTCYPLLSSEQPDPDHPYSSCSTLWDPEVSLSVAWRNWESSNPPIQSLFQFASAFFPLSNVQTVFVDCFFFRRPEFWWTVFGKMKHVKRLVVSDNLAFDGFVRALQGEGNTSGTAQVTESHAMLAQLLPADRKGLPRLPHLFPALTHLTVEGVDFERQEQFEALLDVLSYRCFKRSGLKRLSRLYLRKCNVRHEHLVSLAGCISHEGVDWDKRRRDAHAFSKPKIRMLDELEENTYFFA
ncbi:hypothetical protein BV25DRAFT_1565659 [Artomyces pyxidatus]|uniref:Uncharacterized protein n=1 Tax=Artomyces pyxidatus TaxID=48021 RepID=A0ACB8SK40_9AGAM|nr:hypothetical protein BV25DRAFT_1565659 [Artomyces pyxidatus]